ncbi:hypothetical protein L6164_037083 [Bauhinia variegata]|uniref:Uncharacterized protein n=1 Tax=Bauhinia variegata TaxID=167791 RepID=A0ACB9KJ79_BAUVA|nr:hypothetical protein L6164_037083 [Bauhinia variegata]
MKFKTEGASMPILQSQFVWRSLELNKLLCSKLTLRACAALPRRLDRVWSHSIVHACKMSTRPENLDLFVKNSDTAKVKILKQKMEPLGINLDDSYLPGKYQNLYCPKCKGGQSVERSLSFHIIPDGTLAMWRCFRTACGWAGQAFADDREFHLRVGENVKSYRQMTEKSLGLEPLGPELIAYFNDRLISEKTLKRNAVMQMSGNQTIIAFTYKQNGVLVGCKYRTMEKRFWQEKGTDKTLYGIDDISDAAEIIIVEGEIDKLSLEEAGLQNCVSVPGGAPGKVSSKELPPIEKDTAYPYIWKCREYLDKAACIILATDNDPPGQALAAELTRRLGRERCCQVHWPKKDALNSFKDANEVLKYLGPAALKSIIENAKLH